MATRANVTAIIVSRCKEAGKVLAEAEAGFLGGAVGIGINRAQKVPDLLPNLGVAWRDTLTWLDVVLHLRTHCHSPRKTLASLSKEDATRSVTLNTCQTSKFRFWGKTENIRDTYPGKWHFGGVFAVTLPQTWSNARIFASTLALVP